MSNIRNEQLPEQTGGVPDLPGCIAVGESTEEVLQLIQGAIEFHIEDIKEKDQQIPIPHTSSSFVEIQA
ncbi:MAG: type II toxin-antitoxin system HicB family antitoxin [Pseudomonadota bacterium]